MPLAIPPDHPQIADYLTRLVRTRERGGVTEQHLRGAMQTLLDNLALSVNWQLIPEFRLKNGKVPDGTLIDDYKIPRGYWEAKDTADDLESEIDNKVRIGYPLRNTLFEDTNRAVLFQNKKRVYEADLSNPAQIATLVSFFFTHTDPQIEEFHKAIAQFALDVKDLAESILKIVNEERIESVRFRDAYESFFALCQSALNKNISRQAVDEMLVQHLLTERLARTVLENPQFARRNAVAGELEKVMDALFARHYSRETLLSRLNYFYDAIEQVGREIDDFAEKQKFINTLYERFFQNFSSRTADTHGIVYTPQEIVDWMCESVEQILNRDFNKSLCDDGVVILDPATGTGNFVVNLLRRIHRLKPTALQNKYDNGLFANEVMLLPYYVASLNIEHTYYELAGEYRNFEGICFADTLDMHAGVQQAMQFAEENTERVNREKDAPVTVIIGNPPYNVGQVNENDNNKNRKYPTVDARIRETYGKDSRATNRNALADVYVKFFRWASDRLGERDGVVAYVTNNSFLDQIAFDGMRQNLLKDFDAVYHLDMHGNVRKNPKLSGTTHNVFGIQVGVGITLLVRKRGMEKGVFYHRVPETWTRGEKTTFLKETKNVRGVAWQTLTPDAKNNWLTEGMQADYADFLPIALPEVRRSGVDGKCIFLDYSRGVTTCRDDVVYDFSIKTLRERMKGFVTEYNSEVNRWKKSGNSKQIDDVDSFVEYTKIKWNRDLKASLFRGIKLSYADKKIIKASYRPFNTMRLFFDKTLNQESYGLEKYFQTTGNSLICVTAVACSKPFHVLASSLLPDVHLTGDTQCFPLYTYALDGFIRKENITDWALARFRTHYDDLTISKPDIFHYVYAVLHHPEYRTRYAENLKRELPRIPLIGTSETFAALRETGHALATLHIGYETAPEYPLREIVTDSPHRPFTFRVEKMKKSAGGDAITVNKTLTLAGIPPEAWEYKLGNRSALDWIIDQYQVTTDARSKIISDPNRPDDPQYIVRLVKRIVTVSLNTRTLLNALPSLGFADADDPPETA